MLCRIADRVRSSLPGKRQVTPEIVRPQPVDIHRLDSVIEEDVESSAEGPKAGCEKISAERKDSVQPQFGQEHKDYLSSSKASKEMGDAFNRIFNPDEDVHNVWAAFNSLQRRPASVLYESPGNEANVH